MYLCRGPQRCRVPARGLRHPPSKPLPHQLPSPTVAPVPSVAWVLCLQEGLSSKPRLWFHQGQPDVPTCHQWGVLLGQKVAFCSNADLSSFSTSRALSGLPFGSVLELSQTTQVLKKNPKKVVPNWDGFHGWGRGCAGSSAGQDCQNTSALCPILKLESAFSALGSGTRGTRLWGLLSLAETKCREAVVCLRVTDWDHTTVQ